MVLLLDGAGADINQQESHGHTPMDNMLYTYEYYDERGALSYVPKLPNAAWQLKQLGGRCHRYLYHERFGSFCMGMAVSAVSVMIPSESVA